jgi:acetyl-CoA C-acetyltransferase
MIGVGIVGVGQTLYRRRQPELSTEDLLYQAVSAALDDAAIEMRDVDAVIVGVAPDALGGVNAIEKLAISAMGGVGKPFIRINTGGTTGSAAVLAARSMIRAGRAGTVLTVALDRMGQARTAQAVFNTIFDPIHEKDFVLTTVTMAALRASMMMSKYGYTAEHWAQIAERNFRNAARNPFAQIRTPYTKEQIMASPLLAWPIHLYEACPMSEGACAMVLTSAEKVDGRSVAWIQGAASTSDVYAMGDRTRRKEGDLIDLLTLRKSAQTAYQQAGISNPLEEIRVFELYAPFSPAEAMTYAPLGLCDGPDGPVLIDKLEQDPELPRINPSGGPQAANPVGATAMIRIAECALQVRGVAGDHQIDNVERALATGQGGATQFTTVFVLGQELLQ